MGSTSCSFPRRANDRGKIKNVNVVSLISPFAGRMYRSNNKACVSYVQFCVGGGFGRTPFFSSRFGSCCPAALGPGSMCEFLPSWWCIPGGLSGEVRASDSSHV